MGDITGTLLRRWPLSLLGLVAAAAAAVGMFLSTGPTYSYTSTVVLLPPKVDTAPKPGVVDYTKGNPLLFLSTLTQARDILIASLNTRDSEARLTEMLPDATSEVSKDILDSGPVVVITGESPSDDEARRVVQVITAGIPGTLEDLQSGLGVDDSSAITSHVLTHDTVPTVSHKSQLRGAILAGGAVGLLSALGVLLLDLALTALRSRRDRRRGLRGRRRGGDRPRVATEPSPHRAGVGDAGQGDQSEDEVGRRVPVRQGAGG